MEKSHPNLLVATANAEILDLLTHFNLGRLGSARAGRRAVSYVGNRRKLVCWGKEEEGREGGGGGGYFLLPLLLRLLLFLVTRKRTHTDSRLYGAEIVGAPPTHTEL